MTSILRNAVLGRPVWTGAAMASQGDWVHRLQPAEIAEIEAALGIAKARGATLFTMTREDFPLPGLQGRLAAIRDELEDGRGFQLLRGLPVERYTPEEARLLFWGLAVHLGEPEPQDGAGNLMHDIRDTGLKVETTAHVRGFQTNDELQFHNDGGDAFMLLCLRTAVSGGTSKLVSVAALFNAVLARRPDLAEVLQQPFHFDARSQQASGRPKVQVVPLLLWHAGRLHAIHKRGYIRTAQRFEEVPRLTAAQEEALDLVDALCNDPAFHLSFEMVPGDIQLGSNHAVLHSRTELPGPCRSGAQAAPAAGLDHPAEWPAAATGIRDHAGVLPHLCAPAGTPGGSRPMMAGRRWWPLLLALLSGPAAAEWPDRPVRLVVPFAPGGTTDIIARQYVDFLRSRLPQPVLVENRPGAATNIGAELVARAEPDGTTLLLGAGLLVANPVWGPKPPFDPFTAFAPVSLITETQFLIAAAPRFPPRSPQALVTLARAAPNRPSIASAQLDVTVARLSRGLGITLEHVGYRGGAPAMTDAIAGQVDMVVALVPVLLPAVQQGQLLPIGVSGTQRSPVLPQVPSFAEAGFPDATELKLERGIGPGRNPGHGDPPARRRKPRLRR